MFLIIYFYIIVAAIILLVLGIGIVLFISGTVLVIDGIKHKNKPISQPMKIGFGVTLLMIGVNLACFSANIIIDYKMEEFAKEAEEKRKFDYFTEKIETGVMADGIMDTRYSEGFLINGERYISAREMEVEYNDKDRGEPVANLEEHTIYEYSHASGCRMVCLEHAVYCNEQDIEKFSDYYYNSDDCVYEYKYIDDNADTHFGNSGIDADMFNRLHSVDVNGLEFFESHNSSLCYVYQKFNDGEFERTIVLSLENDVLCMVMRSCDVTGESYDYNDYILTGIDQELYDYWFDFVSSM